MPEVHAKSCQTYRPISASANPINFAYIRAPKLILQGRYDEDTHLRTATEPFFALLSEPKRLAGRPPGTRRPVA
jgi:hypothetical protein